MPKQHTTSFRAKLEQDARPVKDRALGRAVNDGELACTISHMSALANFLNSSKDSVLIFEDDIKQEGKASVPSKFTTTMQNVPEDWEFINFGRCWDECENQGFRCVFGLGGKSDAWNSRIPYTRQIKREKAWPQEIPGGKPEMLEGKFTPFTP